MSEITTLGGITVIHLAYPIDAARETWRIACMPHVTDFRTQAHHPNYLRSDDARAVTCHLCKKTAVYHLATKTPTMQAPPPGAKEEDR